MDILVTFDDGTTELRASGFPLRHPGENYYPGVFGALHDRLPSGPDAWAKAVSYAAIHSPRRCGRIGAPVLVWRITGGWGEGEALTGEWQTARVESVDGQLARLARERDAAEKRLADLRAWAEQERARCQETGARGVALFYRDMVRRIDGKEAP